MVYYPQMTSRPLRLLAHLYAMQKASREMSGGILHYEAIHPDVRVQLYGIGTPRHRREEFRVWKPDGIILGAADEATLRAVEGLGCSAAVFVNTEPAVPAAVRYGSVYCDNIAVAEAAARVFSGKHLGNFAFVGTRTCDAWSVERGTAFRRLAAAGVQVASHRECKPPPRTRRTRRLGRRAPQALRHIRRVRRQSEGRAGRLRSGTGSDSGTGDGDRRRR